MFVGAREIEKKISLAPTNITKKHGKLKEFTEKHGNLCGGESKGALKLFCCFLDNK